MSACQRTAAPPSTLTMTAEHTLPVVSAPATKQKEPAPPTRRVDPLVPNTPLESDDAKRSPDPALPPGTSVPGNNAPQPPWRVGMQAKILQGHRAGVHRVVFTPDGNSILSASIDRTVRLWNIERGIEVHRFEHPKGLTRSLAISADGATILTRSDDNVINLWDSRSGKQVGTVDPEAQVEPAQTRAGVVMVEMGLPLKGVRLWDLTRRKLVGRFDEPIGQPTLHPTRNLLIGALPDSIQFWDLAGGRPAGKLNMIGPYAITPDGVCILAQPIANRHLLALASLDTGTALAAYPELAKPIRCVAMSGDGRHALVGGDDGVVRVLDVAGARGKKRPPGGAGVEVKQLIGHLGPVLSVAFSADGKRAVSGGDDKSIRVWDLERGTQIQCFGGFDDWIEWEIITWKYELVIVQGFADHSVQVWDHKTKKLLHTLKGHTARILTMAPSNDNRLVASAGLDLTIRIWDTTTGKEKQTLRGHTAEIRRVSFNSTGSRLVSAGVDGTVRIWDVESGKQLLRLEGHKGRIMTATTINGNIMYAGRDELANPVLCAAFSPDDQLVVSGGADGQVILWDATTGEIVRRIAADGWGNPHMERDWPPVAGPVTFVSISPDHKQVWAVATIKNGFLDVATGVQFVAHSPWNSPWMVSVGQLMEQRYPHLVSESYSGVSTGSSTTTTSIRTYTRTVRSGRR